MPAATTESASAVLTRKVVDAPSDVSLASLHAVAPPAIGIRHVGVKQPKRVDETTARSSSNFPRSSSEKPALPTFSLGRARSMGSCATFMSPQTTTPLRDARSVRYSSKAVLEGATVVDARKLMLGIGRVDAHEVEILELERDSAALAVEAAIADPVENGERLALREDGRAR